MFVGALPEDYLILIFLIVNRKLFVGGLPTSATKEEVQEYFEQYGPVEMCTIKTDVVSGRSRGFGFLIYTDTSSVTKVSANFSKC